MKFIAQIFLVSDFSGRPDTTSERHFCFELSLNANAPDDAADDILHITNAPSEHLLASQREIMKAFRSEGIKPRSMSVGDSVVLHPEHGEAVELMCMPSGWFQMERRSFKPTAEKV